MGENSGHQSGLMGKEKHKSPASRDSTRMIAVTTGNVFPFAPSHVPDNPDSPGLFEGDRRDN
jgi:hypothetical protein